MLLVFFLVMFSEGCIVSYKNHGPYHKTQSYYSIVSGHTREQCEITCSDDPDCAGFGYNTGNIACVKSKGSDPLEIATCSECWFHTKTCTSDCTITYLDHGYNLKPSSTFSSSSGSSKSACMESCTSDPFCIGFGYDIKNLACSLSESSYPQQTTCSACLFQSKQCTSVPATKPVLTTTENPVSIVRSSSNIMQSSASSNDQAFSKNTSPIISSSTIKINSMTTEAPNEKPTTVIDTKQSTSGSFNKHSTKTTSLEISTIFTTKHTTSGLSADTAFTTGKATSSFSTVPFTNIKSTLFTSSISIPSVTFQNQETTTPKVHSKFSTTPLSYDNSHLTSPITITSVNRNYSDTDSTITTVHSNVGSELSNTNDKVFPATSPNHWWMNITNESLYTGETANDLDKTTTTLSIVQPTHPRTSSTDNFTHFLFPNSTETYSSSEEFRDTSTTSVMTTGSFDNHSTAHSVCSCSCQDTEINLEDLILKRKKELQVRVKMLSTTKRKCISASDPRPASRAIGFLGIVVLCAFCAIIVGTDIFNLMIKTNTNCNY